MSTKRQCPEFRDNERLGSISIQNIEKKKLKLWLVSVRIQNKKKLKLRLGSVSIPNIKKQKLKLWL